MYDIVGERGDFYAEVGKCLKSDDSKMVNDVFSSKNGKKHIIRKKKSKKLFCVYVLGTYCFLCFL